MSKLRDPYARAVVDGLKPGTMTLAYFVGEAQGGQTQRFRTGDFRVEFEVVPFLRERLDVGDPVLIEAVAPV